jgi:hypothetical protein
LQGAFLQLAIGLQFFLLFGYLFYFVFRSYSGSEARTSLMAYVLVLVGLITLGMIGSLVLVVPEIAAGDRIGVLVITIADELILALLAYDFVRTAPDSTRSN